MADLLILNYNDSSTTVELVNATINFRNIDHILVVDNNSTDDSFSIFIKEFSGKVEVIKTSRNGGYGYGNNYGIAYLRAKYNSKYIIIANPDVVFTDESISNMESFLESHKEYAIVAPIMHDKHGNIMSNFGWNISKKSSYIFEIGLIGSKIITRNSSRIDLSKKVIDIDAIAGSLLLINTDSFVKAGCYDENVFLYCEETILGFRLKKLGYKSALISDYSYIHNHSVSISKTFKSRLKRRKLVIASKLHVLKDYYNANCFEMLLARIIAFFSLAETFLLSLFKKG